MYRSVRVQVQVGDDSELENVIFDRKVVAYQIRDLEAITPTLRVAPGAAEAQVNFGALAQGYFVKVFSDYPVMVRLNGVSATQFTLTSQNVTPLNLNAPYPPMCEFGGDVLVSSLYIAPIAGASRTATVWVVITGDPESAYV